MQSGGHHGWSERMMGPESKSSSSRSHDDSRGSAVLAGTYREMEQPQVAGSQSTPQKTAAGLTQERRRTLAPVYFHRKQNKWRAPTSTLYSRTNPVENHTRSDGDRVQSTPVKPGFTGHSNRMSPQGFHSTWYIAYPGRTWPVPPL